MYANTALIMFQTVKKVPDQKWGVIIALMGCRRTGKIKGIERFLGAVDTLQESLIEVTSGQAKYEHQHRAIVWRMPRLPKEGQGTLSSSSHGWTKASPYRVRIVVLIEGKY